jgi:hypothetical protein
LPGNAGKLSIGTDISAGCTVGGTISNNDQAKCGNITYEVEGSTATAGTVTAKAVATCRGTPYTLKSKDYEVVPNPSLGGSCVWDTKNNTFGGGVTAKVTSAAPTTVTNHYGRCGTTPTPYFYVSGAKKTAVSDGLKVDIWSGNSNQQMTGITIGADCGTIEVTTKTCPNITVKDPNAMCEYLTSWCGGKTINEVKFIDANAIVTKDNKKAVTNESWANTWSTDLCIYVKNMASIQVDGGLPGTTFKVNGEAFKCNEPNTATFSTCVNGIEKADGGYYILRPNTKWFSFFGSASDGSDLLSEMHANCK